MKNYLPKSILLFCLSTLILIGCTENTPDPYIKLSEGSLTFLADDTQSQKLEVAASSAWTAEPSVTWIKLDVTSTSIVVTVDPSDAPQERIGKITIKSLEVTKEVAVYQLPMDSRSSRYRRPNVAQSLVVSPNGKYIGGFLMQIDESDAYTYEPFIIDLATDEWHKFGPYPASLFKIQKSSCISDDGKLFLKDLDGGILFDLNDEENDYVIVGAPSGFNYKPTVSFTSSDSSTWVGYVMGGGLAWPIVWKDGLSKALERPETDFRETPWDDNSNGLMARGCSADGRIIYGSTWTNYDYGMVYWDEAGKVHWVGEDVRKVTKVQRLDYRGQLYDYNLVDGMSSASSPHHISPNGKYICGDLRIEKLAEDKVTVLEEFYPAFYNTETKKTTVFWDQVGNMALCTSDDGIGVIGHGRQGISSGVVVNVENETLLGTTQEWIQENYGLTVSAGYIEYICAGNETMLGIVAIPGGPQGVYFVSWYIAPPLQ